MSIFSEQLRTKTKEIAIKTIILTRSFAGNDEAWTNKKQLIRSSTSVAANYRAASRGRSQKEFYAKLCIAVEELDESLLCLEFTKELELTDVEKVNPLIKDMNDLLCILAKSKQTLKNKLYPKD